MPPGPAHERLASGTRLGPYVVEGLLGAGGMGEVYRAHDERLRRAVAIKVLPSALSVYPDRIRHFELEARLAGALSHPNIMVVFDVGRHGGVPFIVAELLEGQTLRELLRHRYLSPQRAAEIARQIAEGLAAAHGKGIIHRDLKPSNVFLCEQGQVKILDFGLAKLRDPQTVTGEPDTGSTIEGLLGTVGYLAPEQARGLRTDHRADIFALGCVLYEMLTGRRAFSGATAAETLAATLTKDPPTLSKAVPEIPRSLGRVVHRCLEKEPQDRFDSAHDLALALESTLEDAAPWRWWRPRLGRRARRRLRPVSVVLALGVVAVVGWRSLTKAPLPEFRPRQITSGVGLEGEPAISPDGRDVAYVATVAGNTDIWVAGVHGGVALRLTDDEAVDESPAWFPDGSAVAFVSARGGETGIWEVDRLGGRPTLLVPQARDPAVSPDGTRLAFTRADAHGRRRVGVALLDNPSAVRILTTREGGESDHERPRWSPGGRWIAYQDFDTIWVVAATGGPARRLGPEGQVDQEPAWSPDGHFVYFSSIREGIRALWRGPAGGGAPTRVTMGPDEQWPSVDREGRRLAYATVLHQEALRAVDRRTGRQVRFQEARRADSPAVAPDGSAVVFVSDRDNAVNLWWLPLGDVPFAGEPRRITNHRGRCSNPRFSPDGRWIAYVRTIGAESDVWVVPATGGAGLRFTEGVGRTALPMWSPDGSELAFLADQGGVDQVWAAPVRDGRRVGDARRVTSSPAPVSRFAWSPDATTLAFVSSGGGGAIWLAAADGRGESRSVARGFGADEVRWDVASNRLLALGLWGESRRSLRAVDPGTGTLTRLPYAEASGPFAEIQTFDVSANGRWLVLLEDEPTGDVWMLEATKGSF